MATDHPANANEPRFIVALSFPGERRPYVKEIADILSAKLGRKRVFYDDYYEAELARLNLDTYLQEIYKNQSALVVPFFCAEYEQKKWCNVEWRAIRIAMMTRAKDDALMAIQIDDTPVSGFLELDGYIDVKGRDAREIQDSNRVSSAE